MSITLQDLPSSPSKAGNFIIPYQIDGGLSKQDTDNLLKFIQSGSEANTVLANTDSSFFPRAFTDTDLNDFDDVRGHELDKYTNKEIITPKIIRPSGLRVCVSKTGYSSMDHANSSFGARGFQPDVIMISSHQRPGPDGSPALVPSGSRSQGILPSGNMSETGELFAPVRQLTFSDVDQSSHIEENYAQRRVSTPTRQTDNFSRNSQQDEHSGSSRDDSSEEREMSPEFRQLDGEADSQTEMLSTGAFDPMAMGINKEFLDNFTGRNSGGKLHLSNNVFSPLGSSHIGFRHENGVGQANRTVTPPLHSPQIDSPYHNSPYRNRPRHNGVHSPRSTTHQQVADQQELQFSMSPTRNHPGFMPYQYNQPNIDILNNQHPNDLYSQYDFHRELHLDSSRNSAVPLQIRQSVSVGEERRNYSEVVTSSQRQPLSDSKNSSHENLESQENEHSYNHNAVSPENEEVYINTVEVSNDIEQERENRQYAAVPPAVFQQRYLQRTQVSVKLPQATYDSMAADFASQSAERYDSVGQQLGNCEEDEDDQSQELENNMKEVSIAAPAKPETNEHRLEKSKTTSQSDSNSNKTKNLPEKFHVEMRKLADNTTSAIQSEKSKDLNKNLEKTNVKQVTHADHVNTSSHAVVSDVRPQNLMSRPQSQAQSAPVSQAAASLNPSSRLLQETVSQKNKTSQKFVSNAPPKTISDQHGREFKKPYDVGKGASAPTCSGARKTLMDNNADRGAKLKIRSAPVTTSLQKQKHLTGEKASVANKNNNGVKGGGKEQSRVPGQSIKQSSLNNSQESVEDDGHHGKVGQVVTQVEKTSPVADKSRSAPGLKVG